MPGWQREDCPALALGLDLAGIASLEAPLNADLDLIQLAQT
jgi:hypothetical protein